MDPDHLVHRPPVAATRAAAIAAFTQQQVLRTAAGSCLLMFASTSLVLPLTPRIAADLRLEPEGMGVLVGLAPLTSVLFQLPVGIAADRRGRRMFLRTGLLVVAAYGVLRWLAVAPAVFAASQFLNGLTSPLIWAASVALVADTFASSGLGRAIGTTQAAVNIGQTAGLALGGTLGAAFGWRVTSLLPVIPALALAARAHRIHEPARQPDGVRTAAVLARTLRFLCAPRAAVLMLCAAAGGGAGYAANYLLPFIASRAGYGPGEISLLLVPFLVGSVIGSPLAGRLADRHGARLPLSSILAAAAAIASAVALTQPPMPVLIPAFVVFGMACSVAASLASMMMVQLGAQADDVGTGGALAGLRIGLSAGFASGRHSPVSRSATAALPPA